jgi:hypothetical protein
MGMRNPSRGLRAVVPALAAMVLAGTLRADLAPASPFLAPNAAAPGAAAGPASPIELRGLMATPNGLAFCIFDTAKKKSVWIGMNEAGHDFVVKSANPESDSVNVDYQGKSMKLTLKAAKVDSAGTANAGPPAIAAPGGLPGRQPLSPNPGDEQKRLDAVAQEVRRRRQEREKAAQEAQNNAPPPASPNR